jgi:D-alanyl-D-alanine carboxypeptidase/D-alanyl-D-alanine-endopeptidase (penicillin-binding protein 4)
MGAVTDTLPGTWENGMRAIKTFINDEVGIDTSSLVLVDGSGLSRYNLLSPAQIVDLLVHVYNDFKIFPEFLSLLAIGGADGSLEKRMFTEELYLKTRAKTGSLNGVSSLSGYTVTSDNDIVAFSIMMNGFVGNHTVYRELQDKIVSAITQYSSH